MEDNVGVDMFPICFAKIQSKLLLCMLLTVVALGSCKVVKEEENPPVVVQTETIGNKLLHNDKPVVEAPQYKLARPVVWKQEHIKLRLKFNLRHEAVMADAELSCTPLLPSNMLKIDAKAFRLNPANISLKSNRKGLKIDKVDYNDSLHLKIYFSETCTVSDTVHVAFSYTCKPTTLYQRGFVDDFGNQGLFFINANKKIPDYPTQIWSQGEAESNSGWMPCIDAPNQKTSQEIYLTVDTPYTALSNGRLVYMLLNNDGSRTFYWKQTQKHAPYLAMIAVGNFAITEDNKGGKLPVYYYTEPEYAKYANMIFGRTPEMIEWFSSVFGYNYPWDKYAQVAVREFVSGAMENTSATTIMNSIQHDSIAHNDETYEDYIVHELVHQWFGDLVTCESWANLSLNEAFASYGEYLWLEHTEGQQAAFSKITSYRNAYFRESSYNVHPIINYHYAKPDDMFNRHTYQKGAMVLHLLRQKLGDPAFFRGIKLYLTQNAFKAVDSDHLRHAFEQASGLDLSQFFQQWFATENHPRLRINYHYNDSSKLFRMTINQLQTDAGYATFRFRLPFVQLLPGGAVDTFSVPVSKSMQQYSFTHSKPLCLVPDVNLFPMVEYEMGSDFNAWKQAVQSGDYRIHHEAVAFITKNWSSFTSDEKQQLVAANNLANRSQYESDAALLYAIKRDSVMYDVTPLLKSENTGVIALTVNYLARHNFLSKKQLLEYLSQASYLIKIETVIALGGLYDSEVETAVKAQLKYPYYPLQKTICRLWAAKGSENINESFRQQVLHRPDLLQFYSEYLCGQSKAFVLNNLSLYQQMFLQKRIDKEDYESQLSTLSDMVKLHFDAVEQLDILNKIEQMMQ
ncbi:hypothetical protein GC194_11325 [bacterium]|nr:hypothetical protein [bacterium]